MKLIDRLEGNLQEYIMFVLAYVEEKKKKTSRKDKAQFTIFILFWKSLLVDILIPYLTLSFDYLKKFPLNLSSVGNWKVVP